LGARDVSSLVPMGFAMVGEPAAFVRVVFAKAQANLGAPRIWAVP